MPNDEDDKPDPHALQRAVEELYRRVADVTEKANTAMDSLAKALDVDNDLLRQRIKRAGERMTETASKAGQLIGRAEELITAVMQEAIAQAQAQASSKPGTAAASPQEPESGHLHVVPDAPSEAPSNAPDDTPEGQPQAISNDGQNAERFGDQAGSQSGDPAGSQNSDQAGSHNSDQAGSQHGDQAGSQNGNQAGSSTPDGRTPASPAIPDSEPSEPR